MRLTINGEIREDLKAAMLSDLLDELGMTSVRVAVEVNLVVIKRSEYENFRLNEGDIVEIVNFVGGG